MPNGNALNREPLIGSGNVYLTPLIDCLNNGKDLIGLIDKSILLKHGEKKGTYYILTPEIEGKLRDIWGHDYGTKPPPPPS
jgi:hypothetical protein